MRFWLLCCAVLIGGLGSAGAGNISASQQAEPVTIDDSSAGFWEARTNVPQARFEAASASAGRKVYLVGGLSRPKEGSGPPHAAREIFVYNTEKDSWAVETDLPHPVNHASAVISNQKLFVIGGFDGSGHTPVSLLQIYDISTRSWSLGPRMPTPRGAMATVELDGRIHTVGGRVDSKDGLNPAVHNTHSPDRSVGTHEVYDIRTETWNRKPPMPTARHHHAAASVDGVIVVVAGRVGSQLNLRTTELWDPTKERWEAGAPVPTGRSGGEAAARGGWLYLFGGEGKDGIYGTVERYHLMRDAWEKLASMPTARHGHAVAAVESAIFVMTGGEEMSLSFSDTNQRYVPSVEK